ncbi:MAG: FliI/YscN family ATPase [Bordetella sp.]|nr:FliI/YscN family ATPase [Bordetella sp.]
MAAVQLASYVGAISAARLARPIGWVQEIQGLAVHCAGPDVGLGELCEIARYGAAAESAPVLAEVVALAPGRVTLMAYGALDGVACGAQVRALGGRSQVPVGEALLGRIIDGFGQPIDDREMPATVHSRPLRAAPSNPMRRPPIEHTLETGIRCIDGLLTLGLGQRVGIFAGSGVGKSTLLGLMARHMGRGAGQGGATADVNVIALIGERGREVREFIEKQLGPEGMQRSVVVVATADQPALARLRAAYAAMSIAEYFRDSGRHVLLTMDSVTRFAMARREIGLAAGEPPTARGYTPSVFAELPELCERCGTAPGGGSITALLTVLVEGDDLNEPISDALRAILDGHIVLSRQIAHQGRYPAIDVLKSASRLLPMLASPQQRDLAIEAVRVLAVLERNRAMVEIGAYQAGSNAQLDEALQKEEALHAWLSQREGGAPRETAMRQLAQVLQRGEMRP